MHVNCSQATKIAFSLHNCNTIDLKVKIALIALCSITAGLIIPVIILTNLYSFNLIPVICLSSLIGSVITSLGIYCGYKLQTRSNLNQMILKKINISLHTLFNSILEEFENYSNIKLSQDKKKELIFVRESSLFLKQSDTFQKLLKNMEDDYLKLPETSDTSSNNTQILLKEANRTRLRLEKLQHITSRMNKNILTNRHDYLDYKTLLNSIQSIFLIYFSQIFEENKEIAAFCSFTSETCQEFLKQPTTPLLEALESTSTYSKRSLKDLIFETLDSITMCQQSLSTANHISEEEGLKDTLLPAIKKTRDNLNKLCKHVNYLAKVNKASQINMENKKQIILRNLSEKFNQVVRSIGCIKILWQKQSKAN
ncbi:hypothetical protein CP10139811_0238 [Chlamydia ibidis]|uniref:Uncharacterized protein n=2 Tax=Chlamydia ibidis TaxID=1405396 RepID=S7J264_9CHLA|nr:hypothetical protein [Chlamydia ibidis]EPP34318.1 hypothetical protein CP10139811_0238 [Chlamydia ibidis]EQM62674.1 hypothetical protein H359_0684 [Chlamydia ibidis 10-1398/6]